MKEVWDSGIVGKLTSLVVGKGTVEDFNSGTPEGKMKSFFKTILALGAMAVGAYAGVYLAAFLGLTLLPTVAIGLAGAVLGSNKIKKSYSGIGRNLAGQLNNNIKQAEDRAISNTGKTAELQKKIEDLTKPYKDQKKTSTKNLIMCSLASPVLFATPWILSFLPLAFPPLVLVLPVLGGLYCATKAFSEFGNIREANYNIKTIPKTERDTMLSNGEVKKQLEIEFTNAGVSKGITASYFNDHKKLKDNLETQKYVTSDTRFGQTLSNIMTNTDLTKQCSKVKERVNSAYNNISEEGAKASRQDKLLNQINKRAGRSI
jgi:hypothetical protein